MVLSQVSMLQQVLSALWCCPKHVNNLWWRHGTWRGPTHQHSFRYLAQYHTLGREPLAFYQILIRIYGQNNYRHAAGVHSKINVSLEKSTDVNLQNVVTSKIKIGRQCRKYGNHWKIQNHIMRKNTDRYTHNHILYFTKILSYLCNVSYI